MILKTFIFFSSLLICTETKAQFDFIQFDDKIQWAAEFNQIIELTPKLKKYRIRQFLYKNKDHLFVDNYSDHFDSGLLIKSLLPFYESYTNSSKIDKGNYFLRNELRCNCLDNSSMNLIDVYELKQLLFYKNSRLYIFNHLLSPLCLENYDDRIEEYTWRKCVTISNETQNFELPLSKANCINLGDHEQLYNFYFNLSDSTNGILPFTLLNPIFSHHLFEDILSNRITVVDEKNNIIPYNKVINYNNPMIEVPIYDDPHNSIKKIRPEVNIDSFYYFKINQRFYFDTTKFQLFSEINHIDVYKRIFTQTGLDLGVGFYYRIYFIKPDLYKRKIPKLLLN